MLGNVAGSAQGDDVLEIVSRTPLLERLNVMRLEAACTAAPDAPPAVALERLPPHPLPPAPIQRRMMPAPRMPAAHLGGRESEFRNPLAPLRSGVTVSCGNAV